MSNVVPYTDSNPSPYGPSPQQVFCRLNPTSVGCAKSLLYVCCPICHSVCGSTWWIHGSSVSCASFTQFFVQNSSATCGGSSPQPRSVGHATPTGTGIVESSYPIVPPSISPYRATATVGFW